MKQEINVQDKKSRKPEAGYLKTNLINKPLAILIEKREEKTNFQHQEIRPILC